MAYSPMIATLAPGTLWRLSMGKLQKCFYDQLSLNTLRILLKINIVIFIILVEIIMRRFIFKNEAYFYNKRSSLYKQIILNQ